MSQAKKAADWNIKKRGLESKRESNKLSPSVLSPSSFTSFPPSLSPLIHSLTPTSVSVVSLICSWHYYADCCNHSKVAQEAFSLSAWYLGVITINMRPRSRWLVASVSHPWYCWCLFNSRGFFFAVLSEPDFTLEVIFHPNFNTFHYLPLQGTLETSALFGLAEQRPLSAV